MYFINYIIDNCTEFVSNGGILVGFFFVFLECFIPALPLSVFVALNVNAFGFFIGCFISWIATSLGSYICYLFFSYIGSRFSEIFLSKKIVKNIKEYIDRFNNIKFSELVLIITLPFTPSFLVNIVSGLTNMSNEKFIGALLIGKIFSIIFWGYIGKSLIESITDLDSIIYIAVTLGLSYVVSKIVSHKLKIS